MPTSTRETLLSRYHYDPLDRLVNSTPFEQLTQRYYCKTRLTMEIEGGVQRTIVQHDDQLLAQQQSEGGKRTATMLATDQQRSVLNALDANQPNPLAYSPYGHRRLENGLLSLLGFNGERPDPVTGHYHLGNGYRQFNPVLMRFNSPDSWSPFGEGGLNAYEYCGGDPRNNIDPNGHSFAGFFKSIGRNIGLRKSSKHQSVNKLNSNLNDYEPSRFFDEITIHGRDSNQLTQTPVLKQLAKVNKSNQAVLVETFDSDSVTYNTVSTLVKKDGNIFLTPPYLNSISAKPPANAYTKTSADRLNAGIRKTDRPISTEEAYNFMHPDINTRTQRDYFWPTSPRRDSNYWRDK